MGELVGDVGGGQVEGGGEGGGLGWLVGGGLLATATVAERQVAEHPALPTVVPLLALKLKYKQTLTGLTRLDSRYFTICISSSL